VYLDVRNEYNSILKRHIVTLDANQHRALLEVSKGCPGLREQPLATAYTATTCPVNTCITLPKIIRVMDYSSAMMTDDVRASIIAITIFSTDI
jgi:hypothetical protein